MDALDELVAMPGQGADVAREILQRPPMPLETPDDTEKRLQAEDLFTEKTKQSTNRLKAADFAARGIPTYLTPTGDVTPITDESGQPLTGHDPNNNIAWDTSGKPREIKYGVEGPPSLEDPFANVPVKTDESGDQYKVVKGLPWQWAGTDPNVASAALQKEKDSAVEKAAAALGRKLTLDERDYHHANVDLKTTASQLSDMVPILTGKGDLNRDQTQAIIDKQFSYDSNPVAKKTVGWFDKTLSPEAVAARQDLDARRAKATELADTHYSLRDTIAAKKNVLDWQAAEETRLRTMQVESTRRRLTELGIGPQSSPDEVVKAHAQIAQEQESGPQEPGPDNADILPEDQTPAAVELSPQSLAAVEEAKQGKKAYVADEKNAISFSPDKIADGISQASDDGLIDADKAKEILPLAKKAQDAAQKRQQLIDEAGKNPKLKAIITGAIKGSAFAAGFPAGAAAGAGVGAAIPGAGETGISEAIGAVVGGLITGTIASVAVKKAMDKIGEYNDTIHSFAAASELHPNYDAAGNLISFGVGVPRAAMRGIGAAIENIGPESRVAQAISRSYYGSGGGLWTTIDNLSKDASIRAARGASAAQISTAIAARVGAAAATNVAIDTVVNEGAKALGLQEQGETWRSAAFSGLIGTFMSGHGISFKGYDTTEVADILQRGKARMDSGVGLSERLDPQYVAGIAKTQDEVGRYEKPLTPAEQEVWEAFGNEANRLANTGQAPIDPTKIEATARQALTGGQPYGVTSVEIKGGAGEGGTPRTPEGPTLAGPEGIAPETPATSTSPEAAPAEPTPGPEPSKEIMSAAKESGAQYVGYQPGTGTKSGLHEFNVPGPRPTTFSIAEDASPEDFQHKLEAAQTRMAPTKERGSTQLNLPEEHAAPIRDFAKSIPEPDLYHGETPKDVGKFGAETEPHVTALYGLNPEIGASKVKAAVAEHGPVSFTLGKISKFSQPDKPYDVLKVDVADASDLHALHKSIKGNVPNTSDYPTYKPHVTLAYVNKGSGDKYVGDTRFEGQKITVPQLTFSDVRRNKTAIPLTGGAEPATQRDYATEFNKLKTADEARKLFMVHEGEFNELMRSAGVTPIAGKITPTYTRGFGTLKPREISAARKEFSAKASPEQIKRFDQLVSQGKEIHGEVWQKLRDSESAKEERVPEPITSADALSRAQRHAKSVEPVVSKLGAKIKFTGVKAESGVAYDPNTRSLKIDPTKLARSATAASHRAYGSALPQQDWITAAIDHEIIHASQDAVAREHGKSIEDYYSGGDAFPDDLMQASREFYGPEWEDHPMWMRRAEAVRMVIEGRWKGKVTEEIYRYVADWVHYFKNFDVSGNPTLQRMVDDNEKKLRDAGIDIDRERYEDLNEGIERDWPGSPEAKRADALIRESEELRKSGTKEDKKRADDLETAAAAIGDEFSERRARAAGLATSAPIGTIKRSLDLVDYLTTHHTKKDTTETVIEKLYGADAIQHAYAQKWITRTPEPSPSKRTWAPTVTGREALKEGEQNATTTRKQPSHGVEEHRGTTSGENVPPNAPKIRSEESAQASGSDRVVQGEGERPVKPSAAAAPVEPAEQIREIAASQKATRDAKRLADAPETSPMKMRVQREYLIEALDKAIASAPNEVDRESFESGRDMNELDRLEKQAKSVREYGDYSSEGAEAIENKYAELAAPLFEKYKTPTGYASYEGSGVKNMAGEPVVHPFTGKEFSSLDRVQKLRAQIQRLLDQQSGITIDIPGDGSFTIVNTKGNLQEFRKQAKKFPTTTALPEGRFTTPRKTEAPVPALGSKNPVAGTMVKAAGLAASKDETRYVLLYVKSTGKEIVATDGRRLVIINGRAGGSEKTPVYYTKDAKVYKPPKTYTDEKGKEQPATFVYPNFRQVIPAPETQSQYGTIDTAELFRMLQQASQVTTEKSLSVKLWQDKKGKFGMTSDTPELGMYAGGDLNPKTAKQLAAYAPDFLMDAIRIARALGHEKLDLFLDKKSPEMSPAVLKAKNFMYVLMPMRISSESYNWSHTKKPAPETPHPLSPEAAQPDVPPEPAPEEIAAANNELQVEAPRAAEIAESEPPAVIESQREEPVRIPRAHAHRKFRDVAAALETRESVTDVWKREYREGLAKKERLTNTGILTSLADKARLIKMSPDDVYDDFVAADVMPHNAVYAIQNSFRQPDWRPTSTKFVQSPLMEIGRTKATELRRLRDIAEKLVRKHLELDPGEPLLEDEFGDVIRERAAASPDSLAGETTLGRIARRLVAAEKLHAPNAGNLTAEQRDALETSGREPRKQTVADPEVEPTPPAEREAAIDKAVASYATNERDKLIDRIVVAAKDPMPDVVEIFEFKGDNGKWYRVGGVPDNVKLTDEKRSAGFVIRDRVSGTTAGTIKPTREEQEKIQLNRIEKKSAGFRAELDKMDDTRLKSQADYWLKDEKGYLPPVHSFANFQLFAKKLGEGEINAVQVKQAWKEFKYNSALIKRELAHKEVKELLRMAGIGARKSDGKNRILSSVMDTLESFFQTGSGLTIPMSGGDYAASKRRAMDADVEKWTDDLIQKKAQERRDAVAARQKALTNPETLEEFEQFVMAKGKSGPLTPEEKTEVKGLKGYKLRDWIAARGESKLTPEQLAKFDSLRGVDTKEQQQREKERKAVVGQVYGAKDVPMTIEKHPHSKRGHDVFIVRMGERVDAATFKELAVKARQLGGNYSREWKPTGSPAGFMFNDEQSANDFVSLQKGGVDRSEKVQEHQDEKQTRAAQRFRDMADNMDVRADEVLNADRKTNTARRVRMAEGMEGRANADKAMATTLRNLADAIESGEATHLSGVQTRTQVETLELLLRRAESSAVPPSSNYGYKPTLEQAMEKVRYPWPFVHKSGLLRLIERGKQTEGVKLIAGRAEKVASRIEDMGYVESEHDVETLRDLGGALRNDTFERRSAESLIESMSDYDRVRQMGLTDLPSLRAALRELSQYRGRRAEVDPIKKAERDLVGQKIPGFFPTPKSLVDQMIAAADIKPGIEVLEPSAGKGDIADRLKELGAKVTTIELNTRLRDLLKQKGHTVLEKGDFLEHPLNVQRYDRILMNPPFEDFKDIDHVQHAYELLKPGGKLVAIMSRSPFFNTNTKATGFRQWLNDVGGYAEELPAGTFQGKEAFRETGANTSIVEITKPKTAELPAANPFVTFWNDDVDKTLKETGKTASQAFREMVNFFSPTTNADQTSRDLMGSMRGERQYNMELLSRMGKAFTKAFNKMGRTETVKFVDNVKEGKAQADAMQQAIADTIRTIDTDSWKEAEKLGIPLEFLENHYRVMWRIIPGSDEAKSQIVSDFNRLSSADRKEFRKRFMAGTGQSSAEERRIADVMRNLKIDPDWKASTTTTNQGASGQTRRPLQGDRGMMKQHTLPNQSIGLRLGGVPHTYNPWTNFERAQASLWQFIAARRMWNDAKDLGKLTFVRVGEQRPDGFDWINDSIGTTYFSSEKGLVHPGKWAAEEGLARLINNHLSRDILRTSTLGRGLMYIKNATTAMELALSPFHFIFVSADAVASSLGLGLQKVFNRGFLHGDVGALFEGLRDMASSPWGMVIDYRYGTAASRLFSEKGYAMTPEGRKFLKMFPDAARMIREMFDAGMKLTSEQDWDLNAKRAFIDALNEQNYIGATLRVFPAINETLMDPLFKIYIPNIKFGAYLRDYANALAEHAADLASGKITRSQIAREIVRFEEDRFGEMNFDNLYWNRTFKSAMQLFTRSVTWRLGSVSAFAKVFSGQAGEMMSAIHEHRAPRLHRNFAWLFGLCVVTAVMASVIQKLTTGKDPASLTDLTFPQIDPDDDQIRVSLPTYLKDPVHIMHSPAGFVRSAMAGWLARVSEAWRNSNFYGVEIRHEDDPVYKQIFDVLGHEGVSMLPFSIQGYKRMKEQDVGTLRRLLSFIGLNPAPKYISQSKAEQLAIDIAVKRSPPGVRTQEQSDKGLAKSQLRLELRRSNVPRVNEIIQGAALTPKEIQIQQREAKMTPLQARVNRLSLEDVQRVEKVATPTEKVQLAPIIARKLAASRHVSSRIPMFTGF